MPGTPSAVGSLVRGPDPPARSEGGSSGCAVGELFEMLGRPYMLELLHAFESGRGKSIRFRDLERTLRIPPKTLSERLRVLVERGFLVRRAYRELPPRVEYEPTAKTANLRELFTVLARWAAENSLTATASVSTIGPTGPPPLRPRRARG